MIEPSLRFNGIFIASAISPFAILSNCSKTYGKLSWGWISITPIFFISSRLQASISHITLFASINFFDSISSIIIPSAAWSKMDLNFSSLSRNDSSIRLRSVISTQVPTKRMGLPFPSADTRPRALT